MDEDVPITCYSCLEQIVGKPYHCDVCDTLLCDDVECIEWHIQFLHQDWEEDELDG